MGIEATTLTNIYDALRDLAPFVQFKKREKHQRRSVIFSKVSGFTLTKGNTSPRVFFTFFKLYKWYQITQSASFGYVSANLSFVSRYRISNS